MYKQGVKKISQRILSIMPSLPCKHHWKVIGRQKVVNQSELTVHFSYVDKSLSVIQK